MSKTFIIKTVFLILSNVSFLIFSSQLNSFYEDWEPRSLDINFNNPNIQNEIKICWTLIPTLNVCTKVSKYYRKPNFPL